MYGDAKWAKLFYIVRVAGLAGEPAKASQCEECGECEELCPQKLPIRELLKEVAAEMEGSYFNAKIWFYKNFVKFQRWQLLRKAPK